MKLIFMLVVIAVLGVGAYWYSTDARHKQEVVNAQQETSRRLSEVRESVKDQLKDWHLTGPEIREELDKSGRIVRRKAEKVGAVLADATADARITAMIKAKLVKDPDLSALSISVNTTDGVVTLSGTVSNPEKVAEALKLALETDGVREAVSTLQVKNSK